MNRRRFCISVIASPLLAGCVGEDVDTPAMKLFNMTDEWREISVAVYDGTELLVEEEKRVEPRNAVKIFDEIETTPTHVISRGTGFEEVNKRFSRADECDAYPIVVTLENEQPIAVQFGGCL